MQWVHQRLWYIWCIFTCVFSGWLIFSPLAILPFSWFRNSFSFCSWAISDSCSPSSRAHSTSICRRNQPRLHFSKISHFFHGSSYSFRIFCVCSAFILICFSCSFCSFICMGAGGCPCLSLVLLLHSCCLPRCPNWYAECHLVLIYCQSVCQVCRCPRFIVCSRSRTFLCRRWCTKNTFSLLGCFAFSIRIIFF